MGYRLAQSGGEVRATVDNLRAVGGGSTRLFGISIDGGGSTITTGIKGVGTFPFVGNIVGWNIASTETGNLSLDIYKAASLGNPTASILGNGIRPMISGQQFANSVSVTGWTTGVAAYDNIAWVVTAASGVTKATAMVRVIT